MNFYQYLDTISPIASQVVASNLGCALSKFLMQVLNSRKRDSCILEYKPDDLEQRMETEVKKETSE